MRINVQRSLFPSITADLTKIIRQKIPDKISVKQTINKGTIEYWVLVAIIEIGEHKNGEYLVKGWGGINEFHIKLRGSWSQRLQELTKVGIIDYEMKGNKQNSVYLIKNLGEIIKTVCAFGEIENKRFGHLKQKYNPQD